MTDLVYRNLAFVLAATEHGSMIVNRLDQASYPSGERFGVGFTLLETGSYSARDINLLVKFLFKRREHWGDGVVALDCGANIGTHTIVMGKAMLGWGFVLAFEPQEWIHYALAGNIVLNNCYNARGYWMALGAEDGEIKVPKLDYAKAASFGSLELRFRFDTESIGQPVDYKNTQPVPLRRIDSLGIQRVDLIKIDVEGMELDVLAGARETLAKNKPVLFVERIKLDELELSNFLSDHRYDWTLQGLNLLAVHQEDPLHTLLSETFTPVASA